MPVAHSKACPFCSEEIKADAQKCKHCGEYLSPELQQHKHVPQGRLPSPGVAAVLSVFIPGLGHIYLGNFLIGFAFMFITPFGYLFFILPGLLLHIAAIYTSFKDAVMAGLPDKEIRLKQQSKRHNSQNLEGQSGH